MIKRIPSVICIFGNINKVITNNTQSVIAIRNADCTVPNIAIYVTTRYDNTCIEVMMNRYDYGYTNLACLLCTKMLVDMFHGLIFSME